MRSGPATAERLSSITYEAPARLRDPVYGCVAQIFALEQVSHRLLIQIRSLSVAPRSDHRDPLAPLLASIPFPMSP